MSKTTTLVKNTAIIGLGTISTKALTFFLLPLYTNVLSPDDYGLIDVLVVMSSLMVPFIILEMNNGVFRFLIGTEEGINYSKDEVFSTGVVIETIGLIVAFFVSLLVNAFYELPYFCVMVFYIFSLVLSQLTLNTTRAFGDTVVYSIAGIISTLIALVLNIVLILFFKWKAVAILFSLIIGRFLGTAYILYKEELYNYFSISAINWSAGREMLRYTLPLIPNSVSWWIASASDRLVILWALGATANGVYAAAHKIPGIYNILFSVFSLAWTESAARNTSDNLFIEETVKRSVNIMIYMLFGIVSCSSLFFDVLFGANYIDSYWHIFILLIAIYFLSLSSLYGGVLTGKMASKVEAYTTIVGGIINVLVNLLLINYIGLYAASISTTISYFVISFLRERKLKEWYDIKIFSFKDIILVPLGTLCIFGYYLHNCIINGIAIIAIMVCFFLKNRDIVYSVRNLIKRRSGK